VSEPEVAMTIGPVEYVILGFPGNKFTGEIAPELARLISDGTIRVLDLVFITKDQDGNTDWFEFDQLAELAPFADLDGEVGGFLHEDDIRYAAESLEANSSAAVLVWEDKWATPLLEALVRADGVLLEGARIPHDLVERALADISAVG
jgi:hypothetical protein